MIMLNKIQGLFSQKFSDLVRKGEISFQKVSNEEKIRHLVALTLSNTLSKQRKQDATLNRNIFERGGSSLITSVYEKNMLEKIVDNEVNQEEEKKALREYFEGIYQSFPFNCAKSTLKDNEKHEENLEIFSSELHQKLSSMQDGESLHLEYGHLGHALRLVVIKKDQQYILRLYDSLGALEASVSYLKALGNLIMGSHKKHGGLQIHVDKTQIESPEGKKYLKRLFERCSYTGYEKEREREKTSYFKFWAKKNKWKETIATFTSIAPQTAKLLSGKYRTQKANHCYAKRLQTAMQYEVGTDCYKSIKPQMLKMYKRALILLLQKEQHLTQEQAQEYRQLPIKKLSAEELEEKSNKLCQMKTISSLKKGEEQSIHGDQESLLEQDALKQGQSDSSSWIFAIEIINHKIAVLEEKQKKRKPID